MVLTVGNPVLLPVGFRWCRQEASQPSLTGLKPLLILTRPKKQTLGSVLKLLATFSPTEDLRRHALPAAAARRSAVRKFHGTPPGLGPLPVKAEAVAGLGGRAGR